MLIISISDLLILDSQKKDLLILKEKALLGISLSLNHSCRVIQFDGSGQYTYSTFTKFNEHHLMNFLKMLRYKFLYLSSLIFIYFLNIIKEVIS